MEETIFNSLCRQRTEKQKELAAHGVVQSRLQAKRGNIENPMLHNAYTSALHLIQHEMDEINVDIEILGQRISYMRGAV